MLNKTFKHYLLSPYTALIIGSLVSILASPKWTFTLAPWLAYPLILYFARKVKIWKVIVFGTLALFVSGVIGIYDVFPAPTPILLIILLISTIKSMLPYLLYRLAGAKKKGLLGTLIFPAAFVTLEYYNTMTGGDSWGCVANTQYSFQALQQIASVFGIWGISFLVYWFASLTNWMIEANWSERKSQTGILTAGLVYISVLIFGFARIYNSAPNVTQDEAVKIAGVTINNSNTMESLYYEEFGKTIHIPLELSQTSPILQEANKAMIPFIEDPYNSKYENSRQVLNGNIDQLFAQTENMADQGAKIVVWSEAVGMVFNQEEESVIKRGQELARDKNIFLFLGLAVVNPGPFTPDRLLVVNKMVTIDPDGEVVNVYLKSNPVPFAEQDYGSDDIIPVIDSPYGKLSTVICYDADFPHFLKQTGRKGTDILVVPSGDWKAISPYHSYMASLRGIENGLTVFRPVSRGMSLATDPYGNVLASNDFFKSDDKNMIATVPTKGINTIYNSIGDVLAYLSIIICVFFSVDIVFRFIRGKIKANSLLKQKTAGA